jgi:lipopolysaccharide/colanic/teichoic acid biosynthesis glycosyltransferase
MDNVIISQQVIVNSKRSERSSSSYYFWKRILDLTLVIPSLIFLGPMMFFIAMWIKLDSKGPAVFVQERVGAKRVYQNGRWVWQTTTFPIYKFRTMRVNAGSKLHQDYIAAYIAGDDAKMAEIRGQQSNTFKMTKDPRVTKIGRILRKLSLDELPQLFNVLRGEMSLVGPRPPIPYEVELYKATDMARLAATPGITGWWQVSGRAATSFQEMVELDIEYIREKSSVWMDAKIIFLTIPAAIITQKGAG